MPRRPSLEVTETAKGFLVHVPSSLSAIGKLERRYFREPKDAESFAAKLRTQYHKGLRGGVMDPTKANEATSAEKILKEAGLSVSIIEAVRSYAEARLLIEKCGITLSDAINQTVERYKASGITETFEERFNRYTLENEGRWSARYAADMGKIPKWVGKGFMSQPVAAITVAMINAALRKNGASSASTILARRTRVQAVVKAKEKRPEAGDIRIMTVKKCAAMLRACQTKAERQAVALLLFAGIRPDGELGRLDWADIGSNHITVRPETSKTGTDRLIPITARLSRLLRRHPVNGSVLPPNWSRRIQIIRKSAGVAGEQDVTRHTFASHFLAAFGEDKTKSVMGHTQNSQTLFRHYRRAVTEEAAKKFFR